MKTESEIQHGCNGLVQREVYCCASYLISTFTQGYGRGFNGGHGDLPAVCAQAAELSFPIPDYEEAATQAGYHQLENDKWTRPCENNEDIPDYWDSAEDVCHENNIDPYERDVFEHWIVSEWFGRRLSERGEKVDFDFCNLTIWARTTTGQAISMDHVIREIYKSTQTGA